MKLPGKIALGVAIFASLPTISAVYTSINPKTLQEQRQHNQAVNTEAGAGAVDATKNVTKVASDVVQEGMALLPDKAATTTTVAASDGRAPG